MPQQEPDQLRIAKQLHRWTATGVMVAALALVVATVYAYIAYRQLEQMRSSAIVDQRAGIGSEGVLTPAQLGRQSAQSGGAINCDAFVD